MQFAPQSCSFGCVFLFKWFFGFILAEMLVKRSTLSEKSSLLSEIPRLNVLTDMSLIPCVDKLSDKSARLGAAVYSGYIHSLGKWLVSTSFPRQIIFTLHGEKCAADNGEIY